MDTCEHLERESDHWQKWKNCVELYKTNSGIKLTNSSLTKSATIRQKKKRINRVRLIIN